MYCESSIKMFCHNYRMAQTCLTQLLSRRLYRRRWANLLAVKCERV
eukprot:COSAG02_NODE_1707_length_11230_cov_3.141946_11_plen_46_part_00